MAKKQTQKELDLKVECALWFRNLRETNNRTFLPLFWDEHRYLVLKGGGGSGKSIFAGRKILERAITEPGHRFLVCRKVARTLRESCFKQLLGQLAEFYPDSGYKPNKSDLAISFRNGSEIIFAGLDDVEKLKSMEMLHYPGASETRGYLEEELKKQQAQQQMAMQIQMAQQQAAVQAQQAQQPSGIDEQTAQAVVQRARQDAARDSAAARQQPQGTAPV